MTILLIETQNLNKEFEDGITLTHAVQNVDLQINEGEYVSITGESGSGKSTLLAMLGLIESPTSGGILLAGVDTSLLTVQAKAQVRNKYLGFVFQSFHLIPMLSVFENVMLPLRYSKAIDTNKHQAQTFEMLSQLGIKELASKFPDKLSGGQQQRVAIARALVTKPKLILADEPTGNLDERNSAVIKGIFDEIHQMGTTILVVTHEPQFAAKAEKQIRMQDGRIDCS